MTPLKKIILFAALLGAFLLADLAFGWQSPLLAFAPIVVVLISLLVLRLPGHTAGVIGLAFSLLFALISFGLTPQVLLVSQWKGANFSIFVLFVFFPALLLYHTINHAGGIAQITQALNALVSDRPLLLLVTAVGFSAMIEGVAGFGLPVAIISPILVSLGMPPLQAIASVSIGHSWSVTYGDMGVVFQTLHQLVNTPVEQFAPYMALLLGFSILLCAVAVAHLQKSLNRWPAVLAIAGVMIAIQSACVLSGLAAISNLSAGFGGILTGAYLSRYYGGSQRLSLPPFNRTLKAALLSYGLLAVILFCVTSVPFINRASNSIVWQVNYPQLTNGNGYLSASSSNTYFPLNHIGATTLLVTLFSYLLNRRLRLYAPNLHFGHIFLETLNSSWRSIIGIFTMVAISSLMDLTGMTMQMAWLISQWFGALYPFVSPLIGTLGTFATGSNSNSNVLFALMQEHVATLLKLAPAVMVAAQTTGGSLGSMVSPSKISVGCTTTKMVGKEGDVLRITLPYGIIIGGIIGILTYLVS